MISKSLFRYLIFNIFKINRWCDEAGGNIKIKFQSKDPKAPLTATDQTNPYWIAFKNATDEL